MSAAAVQGRLRVIWDNAPPYRYVPKAAPGRPPGSLAWRVFDRKREKFLSSKEITRLSLDDCRETLVN